jgi:purine nucleosidase
MKRPVVLDTDIGSDVDDLLALVFLLRSSELDLCGVTTVYGDTMRRARLAKAVCGMVTDSALPVVPGEQATLSGRQIYWTGAEGEGVSNLDQIQVETTISAPDFLIRQAQECEGKLEILAIGPLTNIASAIEKDSAFVRRIKHLYLMGGSFYNQRPEHNVRCDTIAAQKVFSSGAAITAIGLDVTTIPVITEAEVTRLEESKNPVSRLLADQIRRWWIFRNTIINHPHDPLAALSMERPDLFRFERCSIEVELEGLFYGITRRSSANGNVEVASDVLPRTALDEIINRLTG